MKWSSIGTAPTGTLILMHDDTHRRTWESYYADIILDDQCVCDNTRSPTHWMPLPEPPGE